MCKKGSMKGVLGSLGHRKTLGRATENNQTNQSEMVENCGRERFGRNGLEQTNWNVFVTYSDKRVIHRLDMFVRGLVVISTSIRYIICTCQRTDGVTLGQFVNKFDYCSNPVVTVWQSICYGCSLSVFLCLQTHPSCSRTHIGMMRLNSFDKQHAVDTASGANVWAVQWKI